MKVLIPLKGVLKRVPSAVGGDNSPWVAGAARLVQRQSKLDQLRNPFIRYIMTERDIRWEQRFSNYQKALRQLRKFIDKHNELSDLEKQGLVKAFEYTYELAWTTLKDFLEFSGQRDIYGSRDATRKAFELGLIDDGESWMDMLQSRNLTSHTYNEEVAEAICRSVVDMYFPLFCRLEEKLDGLRRRTGPYATGQ